MPDPSGKAGCPAAEAREWTVPRELVDRRDAEIAGTAGRVAQGTFWALTQSRCRSSCGRFGTQ